MDIVQTGFNIALMVAAGGVGLYIRSTRDDIKNIRSDHKALQHTVGNMREAIPERYATIEDLNRSIDQVAHRISDVFTVMTRIEGKIDQKADK